MAVTDAVAEIQRLRGTHFDQNVVDAFHLNSTRRPPKGYRAAFMDAVTPRPPVCWRTRQTATIDDCVTLCAACHGQVDAPRAFGS
jgi:hypothetical protein